MFAASHRDWVWRARRHRPKSEKAGRHTTETYEGPVLEFLLGYMLGRRDARGARPPGRLLYFLIGTMMLGPLLLVLMAFQGHVLAAWALAILLAFVVLFAGAFWWLERGLRQPPAEE